MGQLSLSGLPKYFKRGKDEWPLLHSADGFSMPYQPCEFRLVAIEGIFLSFLSSKKDINDINDEWLLIARHEVHGFLQARIKIGKDKQK